MIWAIVSKAEMDSYPTSPVFHFYREALGKNNIKLAVVDEADELDFIDPRTDVAFLRSYNKSLVEKIRKIGCLTTAEDNDTYEMAYDKVGIGTFLSQKGIKVPTQHSTSDIEDGKVYFVKPRYGSDSLGVSLENICKSKQEVLNMVSRIKETYGDAVIEDFIDGMECTVACVNHHGYIESEALTIDCYATHGIQTRDCKVGFKECCEPMEETQRKVLKEIVKYAFRALGIKHYARIDFRMNKNGEFFLIDVNLLPGPGPIDHFSKCFTLCQNISYRDALMKIIRTAN